MTELASVLDDLAAGRDPGNITARIETVALTSALVTATMGTIGGTVFGMLSAVPYIGPAASVIAGLVMAGYGLWSGGAEIQQLMEEGKYATAAVKLAFLITDVIGLTKALKNYCFEEGTLIQTEQGEVVIDKIQVGDYVYATNVETGEIALKQVVGISESESQRLVTLTIGGEVIKATQSHTFYIQDKGWTEAGDLEIGEVVVLKEGGTAQVESIVNTVLETPIKVYNFTVEDWHNYYVGELGILVHNTCEGVANTDNIGSYLAKKAPNQVTPGTRVLEGQYVDDLGRVQPWKAYYDEYGRLIGRTDYNAGNVAAGIPNTHYHLYEWGPGKIPYEYGSHIEGEYLK